MESPKIYIVGSGAIGKALAVFLKKKQKEVVLVRGSVDHQPAEENTITVDAANDNVFQQSVTTTTFSNLSKINGIVLITAKAFGNAAIAEKLRKKEGEFSIVLLQNGLNIERPFADFDQVYRCVLFASSQVTGKNTVSYKSVAASPVGVVKGQPDILDSIIDHINTPHFGFRTEKNIAPFVWEKVIINCAFNSILPLLDSDIGTFYRSEEAANVARIVIDECVTLAREYGIEPDQAAIEKTLMMVSQRANGQQISTNEDIRNNRRTEIDSLNLEIARLADEIGKPELVPNTKLLGELIRLKSEIKMAE